MKTPRIANAIGHIDDSLVSDAVESNGKKRPWFKWGSLAACFAVLVIAGAIILPSFFRADVVDPQQTDTRYKEFIATSENAAYAWRWELCPIYEQYSTTEIDGVIYQIRSGRDVSQEIIGDKIGTYTVIGYDHVTEEKHSANFDAYRLKNLKQEQFIALKLDGAYYVFANNTYNPPETLGELFRNVDLPGVVELNRFSENGDGSQKKHFTLTNDDYVWEVLSECPDAPFADDDHWYVHEREYISFTVTSEAIGAYKVAMYVTADGYLWTNMFSFGYLFDIGEDTAGKIMQYAKENSTETNYEPYEKAIYGKVTEITEEYILVDDSILCKNPEDGITYTILLNDIRVSRYVDSNMVEVGETISVTYEGEIDEENSHTIRHAYSLSDVHISFTDEEESAIADPNSNTVTTTMRSAHRPSVLE